MNNKTKTLVAELATATAVFAFTATYYTFGFANTIANFS